MTDFIDIIAATWIERRAASLGQTLRMGSVLLIGASLLVACGGNQSPPAADDTSQENSAAAPAAASSSGPCEDLAITIGDLPQAQTQFAAQRESMQSEALGWQADAQLVSVYAGCDFGKVVECVLPDGNVEAVETSREELEECVAGGEDAIDVSANFYSPETNRNWDSSEQDEIIAPEEASIDAAQVDFAKLRDHLLAAGYGDEMVLPTGVTVRVPIDWNDGSAADDGRFAYSMMAYPPGKDNEIETLNVSSEGTVTREEAAS
jgi:hypothetical protein